MSSWIAWTTWGIGFVFWVGYGFYLGYEVCQYRKDKVKDDE